MPTIHNTRWPFSNVRARISSLLKKPASGGTPAIAIALPVYAQQAPPANAPTAQGPAAPAPGGQAPAIGRLQKTPQGWRASRIVGSPVFNDKNERIGTISDLLVGDDGKISQAVVSARRRLVAIPYEQLRFEQTTTNVTLVPTPETPAIPSGPATLVRIILPGATRDSISAMPRFSFGS